jgi:hypothetical protein
MYTVIPLDHSLMLRPGGVNFEMEGQERYMISRVPLIKL